MNDTNSKSVIWSEKRQSRGITLEVQVTHKNEVFTLSGSGGGYGAGPFHFSRDVSGNMNWNGVIGQHNNTDVHLWVRIENWQAMRGQLSFDLRLWGAYGRGFWLPYGGEHFKVKGSIQLFKSAVEFGAFLQEELPILTGALDAAADDPPANYSAGPQLLRIGDDNGVVGEHAVLEVMDVGIPLLIGQSRAETPPGNDRVIPTWEVRFDRNGLTAYGNVKPKRETDHINLVITAFTSPDYRSGQGKYYAGSFSAKSDMRDPAGAWAGFILQSQQFGERHRGTVVQAHLAGYVSGALFEFSKLIRIP